MIDLDFFKTVNDTSNHLMGSYVLSEIGKRFRKSPILTSSDLAARYGGDEFIIFCPSAQIEPITERAEALRHLIGDEPFIKEVVTKEITGSFGVAWVEPTFTGKPEDLIKAADYMLYRSKETGRNKVSSMVLYKPIDFERYNREELLKGEIDEKIFPCAKPA